METAKQNAAPDVFGLWKEFVSRGQESLEGSMRQVMATDEFAKSLEQWVEVVAVQKQMADRSLEQYLQNTPVPSRSDITRLARQVVQLDARLERLETYLEETLEPMIQTMSGKLDRVIGSLDAIGRAAAPRVGEPSPSLPNVAVETAPVAATEAPGSATEAPVAATEAPVSANEAPTADAASAKQPAPKKGKKSQS